jgi:hypothetical protein
MNITEQHRLRVRTSASPEQGIEISESAVLDTMSPEGQGSTGAVRQKCVRNGAAHTQDAG